jgi:taurine transport system substrate-binding protein
MKKLYSLLIITLLVLLTGCQSNDKVVNIGLLMVPNDAILAKQMGLFEEKFGELGYEVNYMVFDSGTAANVAIVTGETDFATMGNINGLVALGRNMDAELIWIHETLGSVEALAVKKNLNISSPEDLAGLKIATPFSSTAHYILLNVLREYGLDETDIDLYNMDTSSIVAAWENNSIDAAYTWQPSLGVLLDSDGEVLIDSDDMIQLGYRTANIELARKSFAEENPDLVSAYIECMVEANQYFTNNPQLAYEKLAQELNIEIAEVAIQVEGSNWTSIEEMQSEEFITEYVNTMFEQTKFMLEQALLDREISIDEVTAFINNEYALEIQNENTNKN